MVRSEVTDRHTKLKRGDSKSENTIKQQSNDSNNLYNKVLEFEEQEALSFADNKDLLLFKKTCSKFREIIKNVGDLKLKNDPENRNQIADYRVDGSILFAKMKKLNRLEKCSLNHAREKLYEAKRQVDNLHLQWQNLLYETHHLRREITKCLSFKSKDEHIDLVPVEEFYEKAPATVSNPDVTKKNEHQLKLARLDWELKQRIKLSETCCKLEQNKEKVAAEIRKKKDRMENLVPMIRNILAATKPVQEHLGLPLSEIQSEPQLTQLLPPSLYFLSIQADALREACSPSLKVSIIGDEDAAARVNSNINELTVILDTDSEEENRNHHHRRKSRTQIHEEKIRKLLMKHPLSVELQISLKSGTTLSIIFHYLINLRIVTVVPSLNKIKSDGICCRYLLDSRNILNGIYDSDYGEKSPNFANMYQLQQLGIEFSTFDLGIPYTWAQKLCGLDFSGSIPNPKTNAEQRNLSITINRIREHVKILMDLCEQLHDLEKLVMPMRYQDVTNLPVKMSCTLSSWEMLSYEQLPPVSSVKYFVETLEQPQYNRYFEAVFMRNIDKLTAVVIIQPSYPKTTPLFSLFIQSGGKYLSAENCSDVRDMEKEVNVHTSELMDKLKNRKTWILTAQLYKLAICFDIFLECTDRENFPREKLFYFNVRGRTRSLPFKCIEQGNEGLFVQR